MQQNHDGFHTLCSENGDECVCGFGLVEEVIPLDAGGGDKSVGGLQCHADEADLDVLNALDPVGRQRSVAGLIDHVGGEPLKVCAGVGSSGK